VTGAAAAAQYGLRNFDEAQELFEDLLERDPHRIEARARLFWRRPKP
jgi:anaphase-promoting complex subunit 8